MMRVYGKNTISGQKKQLTWFKVTGFSCIKLSYKYWLQIYI